jgi:hypothetical protein
VSLNLLVRYAENKGKVKQSMNRFTTAWYESRYALCNQSATFLDEYETKATYLAEFPTKSNTHILNEYCKDGAGKAVD